jgi:hypothetical protein
LIQQIRGGGLGRGDLTEVEWRILRILLPVDESRASAHEDSRPRTIATSSTGFSGGCARVRRWETRCGRLAETMAESGHHNIDSTSRDLFSRDSVAHD